MELHGQGILIISPESWSDHYVSKHHYAIELARRGNSVFFLNPEDNALSEIVLQQQHENLWTISAPRVAKGLRFYPGLLRRRMERKWLERVEALAGRKISVIWLFENSRFFDLNFAGERLKIYQQMDLDQNFNVRHAANSADICFCNSVFIYEKLKPFCRSIAKIPHGYCEENGDTSGYQNIQGFSDYIINAVFIGNFDRKYLHDELLVSLVRANNDVGFHFVGKFNKSSAVYINLSGQSNVRWHGKIPSVDISRTLSQCDINLLAYKTSVSFIRKQMANPHKIMDYLGSGNVIVATFTEEYRNKRDLLEMAEDDDEFLDLFSKVKNNLSYFNRPDAREYRKAFARQNSYPLIIDRIQERIRHHCLKSEGG